MIGVNNGGRRRLDVGSGDNVLVAGHFPAPVLAARTCFRLLLLVLAFASYSFFFARCLHHLTYLGLIVFLGLFVLLVLLVFLGLPGF